MRRISGSNSEYPPLLREAGGPPSTLYLAGSELPPAPFIAVVGARRATRYGLQMARDIAAELASAGVVIVSGMALGIDRAAHEGAIAAGGTTVAVLGSGVDVCYPPRNRDLYEQIQEVGTLVSEYPPGLPPLRHHFPARNRIIAGACLGVVIVEARMNGGAMITARLAAEAGREVFCVPGSVRSPQSAGPHWLIREGARMVTSGLDILEDIGVLPRMAAQGQFSTGPVSPAQPFIEVSNDEAKVLGSLEAEPVLLDTVAAACRLPTPAAAAILAKLELKGLVHRHAGARFSLS